MVVDCPELKNLDRIMAICPSWSIIEGESRISEKNGRY